MLPPQLSPPLHVKHASLPLDQHDQARVKLPPGRLYPRPERRCIFNRQREGSFPPAPTQESWSEYTAWGTRSGQAKGESPLSDSNRRPLPYHGRTGRHEWARTGTHGQEIRCSDHLSPCPFMPVHGHPIGCCWRPRRRPPVGTGAEEMDGNEKVRPRASLHESHRAFEQKGVHECLREVAPQLALLDVELLGEAQEGRSPRDFVRSGGRLSRSPCCAKASAIQNPHRGMLPRPYRAGVHQAGSGSSSRLR